MNARNALTFSLVLCIPVFGCGPVRANPSGNYRAPSDKRPARTSDENETAAAAQGLASTMDFDTLYRPVVVDNAEYQTIIAKRKKAGRHPAVLLIEGLGCNSLKHLKPDDAYAQLLYGLTQKGFVTMRLEKTVKGASRGPIGPLEGVLVTQKFLIRGFIAAETIGKSCLSST